MIPTERMKEQLLKVINKFHKQDDETMLDETMLMRKEGSGSAFLSDARGDDLNESYLEGYMLYYKTDIISKQEMELMIRIRKELKHEYDPLMKTLNKLDNRQSGKIHKKYILDSLKEHGVTELTKADQGILFAHIIDRKEMVLYNELIHKIFPMLNDKSSKIIYSLDGLVDQIKKEMRLRGVKSSQIYLEFKDDRFLDSLLDEED